MRNAQIGKNLCGALLLAGACFIGTSGEAQSIGYDAQVQQSATELQSGQADRALADAESAVLAKPERWDAFAAAGRALLALKRYEDAADALSKAIERAPPASQPPLRELRRQCLLAEVPAAASPPVAAASQAVTSPPEATPVQPPVPASVPAKAPPSVAATKHAQERWFQDVVWTDHSDLMWMKPWYYPANLHVPWDFRQAEAFCAGLDTLGYTDWRLPTVDELQRMYHVSSRTFRWSAPKFEDDSGLNAAMKRGVWKVPDFWVNGDRFDGNRLLIWTRTAADQPGEHVAVYFGQSFDIADQQKVGSVLPGSVKRRPFQGYALCVRPANQS